MKMGMQLPFSAGAAFSGISDTSLQITAVIHQAFVNVNEKGTEAAAATAVILGEAAEPSEPVVFQADHPFVFLLRDNHTGSILFLGRLTNPSEGA